ncbi:hypothetical protein ACS0TY_001280 [Phlomoides rotata]
MEKSQSRRWHQSAAAMQGGVSPHLLRTKSGGTVATSKYSKGQEISVKKAKKKPPEESGGDGGLVRFLPRSASKREQLPTKRRSGSTSPSAWALSPGRSLPLRSPAAVAPKYPASFDEKIIKKEAKGGVGGVLKYFRQKKVSPLLEEEYHQYRVMYNRLLQWRFANARGEASMAAVKRVAQEKVLSRWIRISGMRVVVRAEKRCEIQKQKHEMKMYGVLRWEMGLLNEWRSKIEAKNIEAVGRVVRKLSAISHSLPLLPNAQV